MNPNQPVYLVLSRRQLQEMLDKLDSTRAELVGSDLKSPSDCCSFRGTVDVTGTHNSDSGEWQVSNVQ